MSEAKQFDISKKAVIAAFQAVKENAGSYGADEQTIKEFEEHLNNNLYKLWNRMASGSYFPKPVRAVAIPKKNGGIRILGIPTVEDRIAQMVAKMYFEPLVEPMFYNDSYGYRPNKSAIQAVGQARERCFKRDWVLELDIKGLFDNIKHGYLMYMVEKHTQIKWLILYIKRWLTVPFIMSDKGDLEAEEYWKEKVKNMPSFPKLNYQKKFAEVQNVRFDRIECDFSFIETQRLYQKIKNYHFTPAAVISTIFMKTLAQYSETPGLSINVTLFNRQLLHEDVNGILGEFTNNAVISYQEKTDSLLDAIRATQEQMWRLVQYRKFEGSNILKMLSSGRAGKAIMPVVFTCMLEGNVSKVTKKRYSFKEEYAISQTPQVVLDHHVRDDLGYLKISWDYIIDIFDKQYITDIFGAYVNNIKKFMEKY